MAANSSFTRMLSPRTLREAARRRPARYGLLGPARVARSAQGALRVRAADRFGVSALSNEVQMVGR